MMLSPMGEGSPRSMALMNAQQIALADALVRFADLQLWVVLLLAASQIALTIGLIQTYYRLKKVDRRLDQLEADQAAAKDADAEQLRRRVAELERERAS